MTMIRNWTIQAFIFILVFNLVFICVLFLRASEPIFRVADEQIVNESLLDFDDDYTAYLMGKRVRHNFDNSTLDKSRQMDFKGKDVFVFLHIQKVGGSYFGAQLVKNLNADPPCKCFPDSKRCSCLTRNNRTWIFSRFSTGWLCGLHSDWTELKECVEGTFKLMENGIRKYRRYHYITSLRDPVDRFLSEWQHVNRGATWKSARLTCNGRRPTLEEVPPCFSNGTWTGVTFDEFMACKHNLAFNRMTRMLANLSLVNCYNRTGLNQSKVDEILISSAKRNLKDFAFFGLLEEPRKSQFLFEVTFPGLKFTEMLAQAEGHVTGLDKTNISIERVRETNKLDILLYQFARDLFEQRVKFMMSKIEMTVEEYFQHRDDYRNISQQSETTAG